MDRQHEADIREVVDGCPDDAQEGCNCEPLFTCHDMKAVLDELDRTRKDHAELVREIE